MSQVQPEAQRNVADCFQPPTETVTSYMEVPSHIKDMFDVVDDEQGKRYVVKPLPDLEEDGFIQCNLYLPALEDYITKCIWDHTLCITTSRDDLLQKPAIQEAMKRCVRYSLSAEMLPSNTELYLHFSRKDDLEKSRKEFLSIPKIAVKTPSRGTGKKPLTNIPAEPKYGSVLVLYRLPPASFSQPSDVEKIIEHFPDKTRARVVYLSKHRNHCYAYVAFQSNVAARSFLAEKLNTIHIDGVRTAMAFLTEKVGNTQIPTCHYYMTPEEVIKIGISAYEADQLDKQLFVINRAKKGQFYNFSKVRALFYDLVIDYKYKQIHALLHKKKLVASLDSIYELQRTRNWSLESYKNKKDLHWPPSVYMYSNLGLRFSVQNKSEDVFGEESPVTPVEVAGESSVTPVVVVGESSVTPVVAAGQSSVTPIVIDEDGGEASSEPKAKSSVTKASSAQKNVTNLMTISTTKSILQQHNSVLDQVMKGSNEVTTAQVNALAKANPHAENLVKEDPQRHSYDDKTRENNGTARRDDARRDSRDRYSRRDGRADDRDRYRRDRDRKRNSRDRDRYRKDDSQDRSKDRKRSRRDGDVRRPSRERTDFGIAASRSRFQQQSDTKDADSESIDTMRDNRDEASADSGKQESLIKDNHSYQLLLGLTQMLNSTLKETADAKAESSQKMELDSGPERALNSDMYGQQQDVYSQVLVSSQQQHAPPVVHDPPPLSDHDQSRQPLNQDLPMHGDNMIPQLPAQGLDQRRPPQDQFPPVRGNYVIQEQPAQDRDQNIPSILPAPQVPGEYEGGAEEFYEGNDDMLASDGAVIDAGYNHSSVPGDASRYLHQSTNDTRRVVNVNENYSDHGGDMGDRLYNSEGYYPGQPDGMNRHIRDTAHEVDMYPNHSGQYMKEDSVPVDEMPSRYQGKAATSLDSTKRSAKPQAKPRSSALPSAVVSPSITLEQELLPVKAPQPNTTNARKDTSSVSNEKQVDEHLVTAPQADESVVKLAPAEQQMSEPLETAAVNASKPENRISNVTDDVAKKDVAENKAAKSYEEKAENKNLLPEPSDKPTNRSEQITDNEEGEDSTSHKGDVSPPKAKRRRPRAARHRPRGARRRSRSPLKPDRSHRPRSPNRSHWREAVSPNRRPRPRERNLSPSPYNVRSPGRRSPRGGSPNLWHADRSPDLRRRTPERMHHRADPELFRDSRRLSPPLLYLDDRRPPPGFHHGSLSPVEHFHDRPLSPEHLRRSPLPRDRHYQFEGRDDRRSPDRFFDQPMPDPRDFDPPRRPPRNW